RSSSTSTASTSAGCPRVSSCSRRRCGWWCRERDVALRAIHGNRVEALLDALIEALPPADPFEPATIVVGSHLVSRWLVRELAIRRGIAAGIAVPTFDRFIETTWAGDDAAKAALLP